MEAVLDEPSLTEAIAGDPLYFSRVVQGRRYWRKQREIPRFIRKYDRVAIRSGNALGKGYAMGGQIVEMMSTTPNSRTVLTGPSFDNVYAGLWQEVVRAYESSVIPIDGKLLDAEWVMTDANGKRMTGWDCAVVNPQNPTSIQGRRGHGGPVFVIVDEASGVEDLEYWTALESLLQHPDSRLIALYNPLAAQGPIWQHFRDPSWHKLKLSAFDHPNIGKRPKEFTEEWAEAGKNHIPGAISRKWIWRMIQRWGADDPNVTARVFGEFPEGGSRQLIPHSLITKCERFATKNKWGALAPNIREAPRGGFDPARNPGGGDKNVAIITNEHRVVVKRDAWWSDNTVESRDRFDALCKAHGVPDRRKRVDMVGIGAGILDLYRTENRPVVGVNFGAKPCGGWRDLLGVDTLHYNLKAELHDAMRVMFRRGEIGVPDTPENRMLREDLTELRYDNTGAGGAMRMEEKDKHRNRAGRSPDDSDALVTALHPDGFAEPTPQEYRAFAKQWGR